MDDVHAFRTLQGALSLRPAEASVFPVSDKAIGGPQRTR
jgi:hypothetical protein